MHGNVIDSVCVCVCVCVCDVQECMCVNVKSLCGFVSGWGMCGCE